MPRQIIHKSNEVVLFLALVCYFGPFYQLFKNPDLLSEYKDTILKITKELFDPSVINPRIDSVVDMIRPDVEWDQSLGRVGQTPSLDFLDMTSTDPNVNLTEILSQFFPPGMNMNMSAIETPVSFDQAVNGPIDSGNTESVRGFINKKAEAVLAFHNQSKL